MLPVEGEPNRGATVGFLAPQGFLSFSYYIKSTLVERVKSDKSDTGSTIKVTVICHFSSMEVELHDFLQLPLKALVLSKL